MGETGGAAVALGIWYQSIGAVVRLFSDWKFDGEVPSIYGKSLISSSGKPLRLLLEYFDIDALIRKQSGAELIQFKVSGQQYPRPFSPDEVRKIFLNASQAILNHEESENPEPIAGFIVASNRPPGAHFINLQKAIKDKVDNKAGLAIFGDASAPLGLFPKDYRGRKTMLAFAQSVTQTKAVKWGFTPQKAANACLKAMARFAFAKARPADLKADLYKWLQSWGVLATEYDACIDRILGMLQSRSNTSKSWDPFSIMHKVFDSTTAIPITPNSVWRNVVKDLWNRRAQDPPTENFIKCDGVPKWLLNRSALLRGLPDPYQEDPTAELDSEESYFINTDIQPRIIALVGNGGNGKTSLMFHLFAQIASGVWDWDTENLRSNAKFIGYPIIAAQDASAIRTISGALKRWGHRNEYADMAIMRFAAASRCK